MAGVAALVDASAALLRQAGAGAEDERVRQLPDARTLRYYQSLMAGLRGAIEAGGLASFVERFYRRIAAGPDAGFPD